MELEQLGSACDVVGLDTIDHPGGLAHFHGTRQKQLRGESPMDLLTRKYANGEITTEEFEQRKKVLEKE